MNTESVLLLAAFLLVLLALAWPTGRWVAAVAEGRSPGWLRPVRAIENGVYRLAGVDPERDMDWREYALAMLAFNVLGLLFVYALQRLQHLAAAEPAGLAADQPDSAFNTAVSFVTNTNWQGYGGEATMSYLTQMLGAGGTELRVRGHRHGGAFALIRGFARTASERSATSGSTVTRSHALHAAAAVARSCRGPGGQGVVQNFDAYKDVQLLEPVTYDCAEAGSDGQPARGRRATPVLEEQRRPTQTLPMGPVASQEAIKMIGTNGGGFFNANSAHPFENPTPLSNFLADARDPADPGGAVLHVRPAWSATRGRAGRCSAAMTVIFVALLAGRAAGPKQPAIRSLAAAGRRPARQRHAVRRQHGGQGGPVRHRRLGAVRGGRPRAASSGAVNAMHDSFMPLGGLCRCG